MGHRNGTDINWSTWSDYTDKVTCKKAPDYWAIVLGNIFLQFRKMNPLLVYKEFPLCHATGRTERIMRYPSWSPFVCTLSIRLESGPLAFIQAKLVVKSMTLKRFKTVKPCRAV